MDFIPQNKILNLFQLALTILLFHQGYCFGSNDSLTVYAQKISGLIQLDGLLEDYDWAQCKIYSEFIQREPHNGQPASEKTELKILFDEDNLYLGIKCFDDNPTEIIANEMRRDNILLNNDAVEIFIDSYHDHKNAFYFSTNALGAQHDGIIIAGATDEDQNWDWNGVWECKSQILDDGWSTEIKIPFKILRYPQIDVQEWGFNVSRVIPRKREESYLFPISRELGFFGKFHLSVFGHLKGIQTNSATKKKRSLRRFG